LRYVLLNNTSLQITSETYKNLVQIAKDDLVVVEKIFYNLIIKEYGLLNYNATKLLRKSLENLKLNKLKEEFNGKNIIFIVQTDKYDDGINEQIKISIETTVRDYGVQQCKIIFIKSYIRFLLKSNNSNTKIGIDEFFYIIHNHLQIINIRDFDIIYFMNIHIH